VATWGAPDGPAFEKLDGSLLYYLKPLAQGSDDVSSFWRSKRARITAERDGIVIGSRMRTSRFVWRLIMANGIDETELAGLFPFFGLDSFRLLPAGEGGPTLEVLMLEDPAITTLRNGFFRVEFSIQQK